MADAFGEREFGATAVALLASFDSRLRSVASGVARGEYVFWLGSGLSRSVVPDVSQLLRNLLSFLQSQVDPANESCRFRNSLNQILDISGISQVTRACIDLTTAIESWPDLADIVQRLVNQYSKVLDIGLEDEDPDFLVWKGIDVARTYGSPELEPAAEHLCIAILILEGAVRSASSANWDGLIESAIERLTSEPAAILRVVVRPEDFAKPEARCELMKFHGCAVKAAGDPGTYRSTLIARQSQISGWTTRPENTLMKEHLGRLVATRGALVVGLSAQDANLHTILHQASENLARTWPVEPPAVVFALEHLGPDQRHVLSITYGESYPPNRHEVEEAALLGANAEPVLLGLVLYTLANKLCALINLVLPSDWDDATLETIEDGVRSLRDAVAGTADDDTPAFVDRLITETGLVLSMFRDGSPPNSSDHRYLPLTAQPISQAVLDPNIDTDALGFLAIAASLLGRGAAGNLWDLTAGDVHRPDEGVCTVTGASGASRVFLIRDSQVLSQLEGGGHVNMTDPSVLVIHAKKISGRQVRSPRGRYGRTGRQFAREVAIESLVTASADADALLASFRQSTDL